MKGKAMTEAAQLAGQSVPTSASRPAWPSVAGRIAGAALLLGMAWIHWHLYPGFKTVHMIGPAFYANAALGALAAVAVLTTPRRWLGIVALLAGLLDAGTLGALLVSLTVGLFGFKESLSGAFVPLTIIVEALGAALLLALSWMHRDQLRALPGHLRRRQEGVV